MDNYTKTVIKRNFTPYLQIYEEPPKCEIEKQEELINKIKDEFTEIKQILNTIIDKNSIKG